MTLIIVLLQSHHRSCFHELNNSLDSLIIGLVFITSKSLITSSHPQHKLLEKKIFMSLKNLFHKRHSPTSL